MKFDRITEDALGELVQRFYAKVRQDPDIGPVFNDAIHDWDEHLGKLQAFWSSVMLTSGRYKGNPMAVHMRHANHIEPEMFDRWLSLWRETATELLDGPAAAAIVAKAERIAESLKLGLYFTLPPKRDAAIA